MSSLQKIKRADVIQALIDLGVTPPPSWDMTELKARLLELEVEKGITRSYRRDKTPLKQWVARLNEAARKKAVLIDFCKQRLQLDLPRAMLVEDMKKSAMDRIYEISESVHPTP